MTIITSVGAGGLGVQLWDGIRLNAKGKIPWLSLHSEPCSSGLQEVREAQAVTHRDTQHQLLLKHSQVYLQNYYSMLIK